MSDIYSYFFIALLVIGLTGYILRTSIISKVLSFYIAMGSIFFYLLILSKNFAVTEGEVFSYFVIIVSGIQFIVAVSVYVLCRQKLKVQEGEKC